MSSSIVRQALGIVDSESISSFRSKAKRKHTKAKKEVFNLVPKNHKLITKNTKTQKDQVLLSTSTKLTVAEARKKYKSKKQILKDNLRKLKLIKQVTTIQLDPLITKQIIARAILKRPVKIKQKTKKPKATAFTEEDFKKFEEEYFDEEM